MQNSDKNQMTIKHFVRLARGLQKKCEIEWTPTAYSNLTADVIVENKILL